MSSTAYLGILVLVLCGSTVVRSRYVDPAISSTPSVVGSTPSIATSTPPVVDNRNVTEQHEAPPETRDVTFDASTLFDGLELAGFRYRFSQVMTQCSRPDHLTRFSTGIATRWNLLLS